MKIKLITLIIIVMLGGCLEDNLEDNNDADLESIICENLYDDYLDEMENFRELFDLNKECEKINKSTHCRSKNRISTDYMRKYVRPVWEKYNDQCLRHGCSCCHIRYYTLQYRTDDTELILCEEELQYTKELTEDCDHLFKEW